MTITQDIEKQYWSIGEVAEMLGVAESCVRYWCQEFELAAKRSSTNHRKFVLQEITKLHVIQFLMHKEMYSIEGAKSKLKLMKWPMPASRWEQEVRTQLARIVQTPARKMPIEQEFPI